MKSTSGFVIAYRDGSIYEIESASTAVCSEDGSLVFFRDSNNSTMFVSVLDNTLFYTPKADYSKYVFQR